MVTRIGGSRRKSRHKLKKHHRRKGKISFTNYFQQLEIGQKVLFSAEPAVQKGMYLPRFHGKVGVVTGQSGKCYEVKIKDINKEKTLTVHPIHLRKV